MENEEEKKETTKEQEKSEEAPHKKNQNFLNVLVGIVVILVILAIVGIAVNRLLTKDTQKSIVEESGTKVEIEGGEEEATVEVKSEEGEVVVGEQSVPEDFPSDFPIYEGAQITSSASTQDGTGLTLTSSDSVGKVGDFYKNSLTQAGWEITSEASLEDSQVFSAKKGETEAVIAIGDQEGETIVIITIGQVEAE